MGTKAMPARQFRCRLDELGPLDQMVRAMFNTEQAGFAQASSDFAGTAYGAGWDAKSAAFAALVPTAVRRSTDKEATRAMTDLSKSLRDPLNLLNIRLNRAGRASALTAAVEDFGLSRVRRRISSGDMEGLDGALHHLLELLQEPTNAAALAARGHAAADTAVLSAARQTIADFNTAQNQSLNARLVLTEENINAGNALWAYIAEVLETGWLYYKESQPKKAKTFRLATLMKRIRKEGGGEPATE